MKTTKFFFVLTLFCFVATNAQITKGNWMVGGDGNLSFYKSTYYFNDVEKSTKGIGFSVSPNLGYFFTDKFALGSKIKIGHSIPENGTKSTSFAIGPFARYYFLKEGNLVNLFAEASYTFGKTFAGKNTADSNGYGLSAGSVIFFNSSVGLEVSLDYDSSKLLPKNSSNSSNNILQIGIGFQIHLEK